MAGALLYYRLTSLGNLVAYRLRRLRQPKYLFGTLVAVAYFYYFVFRRVGVAWAVAPGGMRPGTAAASSLFAVTVTCAALSILALIRIAFAWAFPPDTPGFRFSEAEIGFLFPAPIPRRMLIHYRLLSNQAAILFTSVLIALVFTRGGSLGVHRAYRAVGWWVILSLFDLHLNGTRMTIARLRERSSHDLLWRLAAVAAIVLYATACFWSAFGVAGAAAELGNYFSGHALDDAVTALLASPVFPWLSLPFRIAFGPYAATSAGGFFLALAPALLLLGIHYYWVLNTEAKFEEGSIAMAEKRAAAKAAAARGEGPKLGTARPKALSGPFPLAPVGPPEIAFLWKNLLSMRSVLFSRRALFIVLGLVTWVGVALRPLLAVRTNPADGQAVGAMVLIFSGIVALYTLLLGPQLARQDLRGDLANADLLKTYPIAGWRLALGELLAPTLLLSLVLWFTIAAAAAAFDPAGRFEAVTPAVRATIAACLALAAPLVCLIQLIVPNTIMVLFPGWYQAARSRTAGVEMFGQRIIFGLAQFLFALVVLLPAAGWAGVVAVCSYPLVGVAGAALTGSLMAGFILVAEAAVGLWWLGERFGHFDLSGELR